MSAPDSSEPSSRAPLLAVAAGVIVLIVVPLVSSRDEGTAAMSASSGPTLTVLLSADSTHAGIPAPAKPGRLSGALAEPTASHSGARALRLGDVVHPGDVLRFTLHTPDGAHVAVIGVDGAGARMLAGPLHVDAGETALPGAIALDAALGEQRFVAFACQFAPPTAALLTAARSPRPGVDGCAVDVVTAVKVAR